MSHSSTGQLSAGACNGADEKAEAHVTASAAAKPPSRSTALLRAETRLVVARGARTAARNRPASGWRRAKYARAATSSVGVWGASTASPSRHEPASSSLLCSLTTPEVIHHQLDERLLARANTGLAADPDEQRPLASRSLPSDHQVVHRGISALLEPDPCRGHLAAEPGDRTAQQQLGQQRTAVGMLKHHAAAASGVRARLTGRRRLAPLHVAHPAMPTVIRSCRAEIGLGVKTLGRIPRPG